MAPQSWGQLGGQGGQLCGQAVARGRWDGWRTSQLQHGKGLGREGAREESPKNPQSLKVCSDLGGTVVGQQSLPCPDILQDREEDPGAASFSLPGVGSFPGLSPKTPRLCHCHSAPNVPSASPVRPSHKTPHIFGDREG